MNARARRLAPFAGYLMVALVFAAIATASNTPDAKASGAKVIAYYQHHRTNVHVQDFLLAYAALAAVVYFSAVATFLRSRGSQILATTMVGGGVLLAGGLCVGAGLNEALTDQPSRMSTATAQALNLLSNDLFGVMLFGGLALATTSAGVAMLRTKALPTALGVITTIVGVAAGTGILSWFAFMASGLLALVVAPYVYSRSGQPGAITLPDANVQIPEQPKARTEAKPKAKATSG
ncbi:MAG: hypothetical protein QOD07_392 [Frankiaceae bacterium]|jgi:hypothetical protein|nr:hypothetical protein [Frankiaceae bacterium]